MTVPAADVLDHTARAHLLRRWEVALWWIGSSCLVVAVTTFIVGTWGRAVLALLATIAIRHAREACGRAAAWHADWLREDARVHHEVHLPREGGR